MNKFFLFLLTLSLIGCKSEHRPEKKNEVKIETLDSLNKLNRPINNYISTWNTKKSVEIKFKIIMNILQEDELDHNCSDKEIKFSRNYISLEQSTLFSKSRKIFLDLNVLSKEGFDKYIIKKPNDCYLNQSKIEQIEDEFEYIISELNKIITGEVEDGYFYPTLCNEMQFLPFSNLQIHLEQDKKFIDLEVNNISKINFETNILLNMPKHNIKFLHEGLSQKIIEMQCGIWD
tara:strand:+ start:5560 stop:6255 length:696 start_codon:yes stop_codon:yes gene_type:complete